MCGIALILGPAGPAADDMFRRMLAALAPRGETLETHCAAGLLAGTQRLRIVDRDAAVQPWVSPGGRHVLCYNGELFNYRDLAGELAAVGSPVRAASDTAVVAAAFTHWGEQAVTRFRGEFAIAIADTSAQRMYLARDPAGVKPLYWARRDGRLHVASEIKALVPLGAPVREVPPGHHGWADAAAGPDLRPYPAWPGPDGPVLADTVLADTVLADTVLDSEEMITDPVRAAKLVRAAFEDAVRVRVDTDLTVGVILSGGLDSSLTLLQVAEMHPDCVAFTVGAPGSEDLAYAGRLCADLGVRHEMIEIDPRRIRLADIKAAIAMSELTEYGDIINAVVSMPVFRAAAAAGVKVVLTGDGSDELFGGYPMYRRTSPAQARRLFQHKIANLGRTELQRVDRVSMGHGVEARVPFLDPALVSLARRLPMSLKVRDGQEKWVLREAFAGVAPRYILERPKNPMSHSSGLHERARLYKPLFAGIHRSLRYDLCAPVRRDFSAVLEACGNDLDLAALRLADRPDYTVRERARDLAGALRWNVTAAARRRARA